MTEQFRGRAKREIAARCERPRQWGVEVSTAWLAATELGGGAGDAGGWCGDGRTAAGCGLGSSKVSL